MLAPQRLCFLIADISGYTSYLGGVELDHAQDILADIVGTVVSALRPTFRLAKLEGDAAFVVAPAERIDGSLLLDTIEHCYGAFRRRRRDVRQATSCGCDACIRIPDLDLKFVVHVGEAIARPVAGQEELMGADVIVVHRLLKSDVVQATGIHAYALLTESATTAVQLRPADLGMTSYVGAYEGIGEVAAWVHDLERAWRQQEAAREVIVTPSQAMHVVDIATVAPAQMVWEFLTTPGRRMRWQQGVTGMSLDATGNRRGQGATNHCMHGQDAIVEEILDWSPFHHLTIRSTMGTPGGPLRFLMTWELEPAGDGTVLHARVAPTRSPKDRALLQQVGPMLGTILDGNVRMLGPLLDAEASGRS
jgi:uncharacterized protein YndB with AHSA1/START domain